MLDLVAEYLEENGLMYVPYHGKMDVKDSTSYVCASRMIYRPLEPLLLLSFYHDFSKDAMLSGNSSNNSVNTSCSCHWGVVE